MKKILTIFIGVTLLMGCSTIPSVESRTTKAVTIATQGQLRPSVIEVEGMALQTFKKLSTTADTARLYIEGDGFAYVTRSLPSADPTPLEPTALTLASVDPAENVIYLARPCQYKRLESKACGEQYWTTHRYSAEVLSLYMEALNKLKQQHSIKRFELVGFSGGGALAALLAQKRDDIANLRTVAANLDLKTFAEEHNITPFYNSLNPADTAQEAADIPQRHFVGARDTVVPASVVKSYLMHQSGGAENSAARLTIVPNMGHHSKWYEKWPDLLEYSLETGSE